MFEKYSTKREKKEGFSFKKLASMVGASLLFTGLVGGKAQAQSASDEQVIKQVENAAVRSRISNSKLLDASFLTKDLTPEELAKSNEARANLYKRLDKIKNIYSLSVPEKTSKKAVNIDPIKQKLESRNEVSLSNTKVFLLENNSDKNEDFVKILVENNTARLSSGARQIKQNIVRTVDTKDNIISVSAFVATENDNGEFVSKLDNQPGYVGGLNEKGTGYVEDTSIPILEKSRLNKPIIKNHVSGDIIAPADIATFEEDGLAAQEVVNRLSHTTQALIGQEIGAAILSKNQEVERGLRFDNEHTTKRISTTQDQTHIEEVVLGQTLDMANTNQGTAAAQTGINLLSAIIDSPLKNDVREAKSQHAQRVASGTEPTKPIRVQNTPKVQALYDFQNDLTSGVQKNIGFSKTVVEANSKEGIAGKLFFGNSIRQDVERSVTTLKKNKSDFEKVFTVGGGTDGSYKGIVEFNGDRAIPTEDGRTLNGRRVIAEVQASQFSQDLDTEITQATVYKNKNIIEAGGALSYGYKDLIAGGKISLSYDGEDVYPQGKLQARVGKKRKTHVQGEVNLSAKPGLNKPNEAVIKVSAPISVSDKIKLKLGATKEFDLGGNDVSYKTRSKGSLDIVYNNAFGFGVDKIIKDSDNSYEGMVGRAFLKNNWGVFQSLIYTNLSKIDETKSLIIGAKTVIDKKITLDGSFSKQNAPGTLNDENILQFMIGVDH